MRRPSFILVVALASLLSFVALLGAGACQDVPVDNGGGNRVIAPSGIIEGTVLYQGPHPCTQAGHIVGNLILLFFNANDRPPPAGVASTAVNFGVVQGDVLFANEPRTAGSAVFCPKDRGETATITASAPFTVSPFGAGTYIIESFFDYTGTFLPTFKFRELPERGDVAGGYIDTTDALLHADAGVDYKPIFLPVTVGVSASVADAGPDALVGAGTDGGSLVLPASGYVTNNITVSVGAVEPLPRPYFYPDGVEGPAPSPMRTSANPSGDVNYVPAQTMAQDIEILAQPPLTDTNLLPDIMTFQESLTAIKFNAGVPPSELAAAADPAGPFQFQLDPSTNATSLFSWTDGTSVPESMLISNLLPQVVFTKLIDDPMHLLDPQGIIQQVPPTGPLVIILGLTLGPLDTVQQLIGYPIKAPGPTAATDHITALVRPLAVCLDPTQPELGATIVAPFLSGKSADPKTTGDQPLFDPVAVIAALTPIFGKINTPPTRGCLPPGRYAPNLVYPTGQAWTVPNESGSCAVGEGALLRTSNGATCAPDAGGTGRAVLPSQGPRAVLEITETAHSETCRAYPVPSACLPKTSD